MTKELGKSVSPDLVFHQFDGHPLEWEAKELVKLQDREVLGRNAFKLLFDGVPAFIQDASGSFVRVLAPEFMTWNAQSEFTREGWRSYGVELWISQYCRRSQNGRAVT